MNKETSTAPIGKHTPGPWVATFGGDHTEWKYFITSDSTETVIAIIETPAELYPDKNPCRAAADAALMASAPDLLAALEAEQIARDLNQEVNNHFAMIAAIGRAQHIPPPMTERGQELIRLAGEAKEKADALRAAALSAAKGKGEG